MAFEIIIIIVVLTLENLLHTTIGKISVFCYFQLLLKKR